MAPIFRASLRQYTLGLSAIMCLALPAAQTQAQTMFIVDAVPTAWRLQDYLGGAIHIWFTGSSCSNGNLTLLASVPEGVKDRLWSTVMSGKLARHPVIIYYRVEGGGCIIDNFSLKETN